jgi:imidazolonepropionase
VNADLLVCGVAQLATPTGKVPCRGPRQGDLSVLADAAFAVQDGRIMWVGSRAAWRGESRAEVDLGGRAVVPGLVDPHTHAVWAGDRLADFEGRTQGEQYETILARGGGIRSTVQHTAAASAEDLVALALPRLRALTQGGATTIETKSGYGFTTEAEVRSLEVIRELQRRVATTLVPTLLIHVPPEDPAQRKAYLEEVMYTLIPRVAEAGLADAVDIFVEREAFSVAEAQQVFEAAASHRLAFKLHADQFHALGGTELGVRMGALSVDHLEASGAPQVSALAKAKTVATLLPGVSLHLGLPPAPGRDLIDAGAAVAVGTDLNPGSSPLASPALAVALAVRLNGLSPAEALTAATLNAAWALGLTDRGRLAVGCRADFVVVDEADWRALPYQLGGTAVAEVWVAGQREVHCG